MKTSENLNEIGAALAAAQAELSTAKKDSSGYGYNYSDLASVLATAKPVLEKNGLSVTQLVGKSTATEVSLTTILLHKSGQFISEEASINIPEMNKINVTQKAGAAISYLRRYSLQAILGMASEDNDASTDARPIPQASVVQKVTGNSNVLSSGDITAKVTDTSIAVSGNPPKLTDAQAKATVKAPSFSRNKTVVTKSSNDLGI
jgi:hypothetical protein